MKKFSKFGIISAALSLLLFIGCSTNPKDNGDTKYKDVEINENSTILCLGNSLTEGYGSDGNRDYPYADPDKSYPAYLSQKVNIGVETIAESGISASAAAEHIKSGKCDNSLSDAAVIIIELGANDLFNQMELVLWGEDINEDFVDDVEKSFEEILDYIKNLNTDPQIYLAKFYNKKIGQQLTKGKIEMYGMTFSYDYSFVYNDYEAMFSRLAKKYGVTLINDIWAGGIWGDIDYMFDEDENGKIEIFEAEYNPEVHPNAEGYRKMADNYFNAMKGFLEFNDLVK